MSRKIMNNAKWLCLVTTIFIMSGISANAQDHTKQHIENDYNTIPKNWSEYFVSQNIIEKFKGERIHKVCYSDDFSKNRKNYKDLRIARGNSVFRYKLMKGGTDFLVLDKNIILIQSKYTGAHLIEVQSFDCSRNLLRAKYIIFFNNIGRRNVRQCLSRSNSLTILTRKNSGYRTCNVKTIHKWTGPMNMMDIQDLKKKKLQKDLGLVGKKNHE